MASAPIAFSIVLDQHSFSAAKTVQGVVFLHASDSLNIRAVRIICKGTVRTRFSLSENRHSSSSTTSASSESKQVTAKKSICKHELTLWGTQDKGMFVLGSELRPGQYRFPFAFHIPSNAPSSYEGVHGRIRYKLRAYLDRPWKSDWVTHTHFHVAARLDPMVAAGYASHRTAEANKQVCCWIWNQGRLHARLDVDPTVIDPDRCDSDGAGIRCTLSIDNWTSRRVNDMSIALVRTDTFHAEGRSIVIPTTVGQSLISDPLPPKSINRQFQIKLLDSSLPVAHIPSILNVDILRVEYAVQVKISLARACPLKMTLPVLVCPSRLTVSVPSSMLPPISASGIIVESQLPPSSSSKRDAHSPHSHPVDMPPPAYQDPHDVGHS